MIPRYSRPEMTEIWNATSKFQIWLDIEKYACEAQEKLGVIPKGVAKQIDKKGKFEIDKIDAIEKEVKHDGVDYFTGNLVFEEGDEDIIPLDWARKIK